MKENTLIEHKIMMPPKAAGTVKWIAGDGDYKLGVSDCGINARLWQPI